MDVRQLLRIPRFLHVDGQMPAGRIEMILLIQIGICFQQITFFLVDIDPVFVHPDLFAQQVAALRLAIDHDIHEAAVRSPG